MGGACYTCAAFLWGNAKKGKDLPNLGADAGMILKGLLKKGRESDAYDQVTLSW